MDYQELEQKLLTPLWRGIPADYKRRYARNIWSQYEDNLRAAAYTSNLRVFVSRICGKLNITIASTDIAAVNEIVSAGRDKEILAALRNEITMLILLVRLENDKRKEEWAARQAELGKSE